ncbi:GNAT family N-acetyltransferase [Buttiauxella sp. A2-C1_F]|uniref:GNAT family N-acetyltransferase n=1 Tax=Buttiauxella sp. A2-C1_F TaxID=2904526 RepID=UPI001E60D303|nr:GNAT family N-acetyltransferase [Buttiauxella sp. A2-C1_F]MCE0846436.1 GNAT family N-acetyltransferase [Buttiauxella sp. A2-C1_F]
MSRISLVAYDEEFLELSWQWLNDAEIKELTLTPNFTKSDQKKYFKSLKERTNYIIFGLIVDDNIKVGAAGLKNIETNRAEYWGYIGNKNYWGQGLGKELAKLMEKVCAERYINELYLKVSSENIRAVKSYLNTGYSKIRNEGNIIIMEKMINVNAIVLE